jgi:hypothetical protein
MKIIKLVIITVMVFSGLGLWLVASGNTTSEERNMNYGISLTTDKMSYSIGEPIKMILKVFNYTEEDVTFYFNTYSIGEPIKMILKVFNYTEEDVTFYFNTSQRYDFIIEDEAGNEIWRWSEGRMFAQMLGEEILGPSNSEVIYTAEYRNKLSPGYYKVTGVFIAQDRPMSGSIVIEVK